MRLLNATLVVTAITSGAACASRIATVKQKAALDYHCPIDEVGIRELTQWEPTLAPQGPRNLGYLAEGCDQAQIYAVRGGLGHPHAWRCYSRPDRPGDHGHGAPDECTDAARLVGWLPPSSQVFPFAEPESIRGKFLLLYPQTAESFRGPDVYRDSCHLDRVELFQTLNRTDLARAYETTVLHRTIAITSVATVQILALAAGTYGFTSLCTDRYRSRSCRSLTYGGIGGGLALGAVAGWVMTSLMGSTDPVDATTLAKMVQDYNQALRMSVAH